MKTSLNLRQSQHLSMTPKLQQAIKLLQLSSYELEQTIQLELEKNPFLEADLIEPNFMQPNLFYLDFINDSKNDYTSEYSNDFRNEYRNDHRNDYRNNYKKEIRDPYITPDYASPAEELTLKQQLLQQLKLLSLKPQEYQIANTLIDAIDDNGYLLHSLIDIQESLHAQGLNNIHQDEILAILYKIQEFEPHGVGARNLAECLTLQLATLPKNTPWLEQTQAIVVNYLDLVGNRNYTKLKSVLKVEHTDLMQVLKLLKSLDPKPGLQLSPKHLDFIIPDVIVGKQCNRWIVEVNTANIPKININMEYATLLKNKHLAQNSKMIRSYLNEAHWLLKGIQNRHNTLLSVVKCIVMKQQSFFEQGEEGMKPLILQDIAKELNLHESTVSRVTDRKYMHTPRGIFELKYFFSSQITTKEGIEYSKTAIAAQIKKLISEESHQHPLSDQEITEILTHRGIEVARRTVTKYRKGLHILPSCSRRHLYTQSEPKL